MSSAASWADPPRQSEGRVSAAGRTLQRSRLSVRRWLAVSKLDMESISSPQNSTRRGWAREGEKKSSMPPRRENWPGPSTWAARE